MKVGARNQIRGTVTSIKKGDVMAQVKFSVTLPASMASVLTVESLEDMSLQIGDEVTLLVKAVHVLAVKD